MFFKVECNILVIKEVIFINLEEFLIEVVKIRIGIEGYVVYDGIMFFVVDFNVFVLIVIKYYFNEFMGVVSLVIY